MNIIKLRNSIRALLLTKCDRVYYERATDTTTYPYVVFNLVDSREQEGKREDFDLEVDVWDNAQDSTAIETLVGNIDGNGELLNVLYPEDEFYPEDIIYPNSNQGLHRRLLYIDDVLSAKIYRDRRLSIIDEDVRVRHRQLKYFIQTYLT
jgi:hypothetical protein